MKKNYTTYFLIFSIIALVAVILLFIFFMKVIKNKNEHVSASLTVLEEKMKEKENAILNASKVTEIKEIQDSINNYFVDPNKIDTFVGYLEGIGPDLGTNILIDSIDIPSNAKNIIAFRLSITGSFQNVMRTITAIENIPYMINIKQIYLNKEIKQPLEKNTKTSTWRADISFNTLSLN